MCWRNGWMGWQSVAAGLGCCCRSDPLFLIGLDATQYDAHSPALATFLSRMAKPPGTMHSWNRTLHTCVWKKTAGVKAVSSPLSSMAYFIIYAVYHLRHCHYLTNARACSSLSLLNISGLPAAYTPPQGGRCKSPPCASTSPCFSASKRLNAIEMSRTISLEVFFRLLKIEN